MQDRRTFDVTRLEAGVVRVEVKNRAGSATVIEVASGAFEPAERGVSIGRTFVPWHRIRRFWWELEPRTAAFDGERRPLAKVRVVLDDGTSTGEVHVLSADRFETGPYVVTVVLEHRVEPERGLVVLRKLCVPWHHVVEFTRLPVDDADVLGAGLVPESARPGAGLRVVGVNDDAQPRPGADFPAPPRLDAGFDQELDGDSDDED